MINIAICDDDINVAKEIESLIKSTINSQFYSTSIYIEAEEFSKVDYAKLDFVFLDIELGDISGIEIATQIRKVNEYVIIFFITNHSRYISEALMTMTGSSRLNILTGIINLLHSTVPLQPFMMTAPESNCRLSPC